MLYYYGIKILRNVKCGLNSVSTNVDQRSSWLVATQSRLDLRALAQPSLQPCQEGKCASTHQFYVIAIILVVLCGVTTTVWLIACWNRPKIMYIKTWLQGNSYKEHVGQIVSSRSYDSSKSSILTSSKYSNDTDMPKALNISRPLSSSVGQSLDAPNLDDLIKEHSEFKKRLDLDQISAETLKRRPVVPLASEAILKVQPYQEGMPTLMLQHWPLSTPQYRSFAEPKSFENEILSKMKPFDVVAFPSLDDLPDPPHITVSEIKELNKALNTPYVTTANNVIGWNDVVVKPLQRTVTMNSGNTIMSDITTKTVDPINRRLSIASTVDFRPPNFLKKIIGIPKPLDQISFMPDPMATSPSSSSDSSLDITASGDKKLYTILQDLRQTAAQKEAELAKSAAENDSRWLKLLYNN
ncbi:unnamed protein product [Bursaphelenchus okinawaensis]|uniref:Uncharacterized protein n=1 Tax=Bursaphelenchus okinawaensis TaxID=465554 RepID=A0A811KZF9_9BILA|nr:unnamed protein product [Bursaphelenchus okinawaensis]CAG9113440.1 unnamed protein product [Bursaphelenchus okinawaensis]